MPSSSVPRHRPIVKKAASTAPEVISVASPTIISSEEGSTFRASLPEGHKANPSAEQAPDTAPAPRETLASLPPLVVERDSAITKELFTDWRFDC